jgi:DNA processing protein
VGVIVDARNAYIALNMMEGVGPITVRALASALGSVEAIFEAPVAELRSALGVGVELAQKIASQRDVLDPEAEAERAGKRGIHLVTPVDDSYPHALAAIHDPPLALYVSGGLKQTDSNAVAVIGTRRATHYGRDCAEKLSYQLSQAGYTVVSGLARGIDTAAHTGALRARGRTIAVIGSGLDCLYPPENKALAKEIAAVGAVVSEFPLGKKPDRTTFPIRNRIVSGICAGVLVVEAGMRSGAIITAGQALEQGRSVFAVPGRIDSHGSRGTHRLIRDGACLVETVEDILEELEMLVTPADIRNAREQASEGAARPVRGPKLGAEEKKLVGILADGSADVDSLIRSTGLAPARVSSLLIALEMKKVTRMLPGRMVELRERVRSS